MLYCVPGFGPGTNFHWLPSQCSIRVRCRLSAPSYCPTDHASVAESAVTAVDPPPPPAPGLRTFLLPLARCPPVPLGGAAGGVVPLLGPLRLHAARPAPARGAPTPKAPRRALPQ